MIRTDKRMRLCTALLILNLAFIWGNSLMRGELSQAFSDFVKALLEVFLPVGEGTGEGSGLLRKIAHFTEFACLGLLLTGRAGMKGEGGFRLGSIPVLLGMAAACVDETIQIFVPGRSSSLIDVWIDTCGAAAGMILVLFGYHWITNRKRNKKKLEETT